MKKFLTVLLALSVVFTYSFSSVGAVFADTTNDAKLAKLNEAKAVAEKMATTYADDALEAVVEEMKNAMEASQVKDDFDESDYEAAWTAVDVKAALNKAINDAYTSEAQALTNGTSTSFVEADDAAVYAAKVFEMSTCDTDDNELTASAITTNVVSVLKKAAEKTAYLSLYNAKKAELVAAYDNVDYSLYLDEVDPDDADGRTYLKEAQDKVAAGKKAIEDNPTTTPSEDVTSFGKAATSNGVTALKNQIAADLVALTYEGTTIETGLYKVVGVLTKKDVEAGNREDAADLATLKAQIQQKYVEILNSGYTQAAADAYVTVSNYLAEKGFITKAPLFGSGKKDWEAAVQKIEDLTAFAAKYKAEKDATGALVRDSAAVDAEVEKATNYVYGEVAGAAIPADKGQTIDDAKANIEKMSVKTDAATLAFEKEVAKASIEEIKADLIDEYYSLEAQKLEAKYAEILEEIEAATTIAKVQTALNKAKDTTTAIKSSWNINTKTDVDRITLATTAAKTDLTAVKAYIAYNNTNKTILDAGYIDATDAQVEAALAKIYGEAGARTNAEINALNVDAATVGASLPTVGAKTAAKEAMEAAINALPAQATETDKAAVEAAADTVKAYKELGGSVSTALDTKLDKAITQVETDMFKNLTIAYVQLDKTDKAAAKELLAKIEAAIDFEDEMDDFVADTNKFGALKNNIASTAAGTSSVLDKIRAAELNSVIKAINAIPLNITLDDKATIEAARAAYDAFVEEWTDYELPYNAAAKVTNFRELALAEAALSILEKDAAIKATEGLKISVSTKLYKGSKIRVNWKIKGGDASYADGYQVWKSKKAQSGYTIMGKTTKSYMDNKKGLKKGTRMYYKVRAYVEIDGVKYYSDWSNKGNRIYK